MHKCIYTVLTCDPRWAQWETVRHYAETCLRTLSKEHSDCTLICAWHGDQGEIAKLLRSSFDGAIQLVPISDEDYERGVDTYKIKAMLACPWRAGDAIVVLDLDTLVVGDLFGSFQYGFDLAFTQRADWHPIYPINLGYVAMRWNARSRSFLNNWVRELVNPQMPGFQQFMDAAKEAGSHEHCRDQDFICHALRSAMCVPTLIAVLPAEYNWFPLAEDDVEAYRRALRSGGCKLIHFRGPEKSLAWKLVEEFGL